MIIMQCNANGIGLNIACEAWLMQSLPGKTIISCFVVIAEVAETRHPNIASNEHTDGVIHLSSLIVVIKQEEHLDPEQSINARYAQVQKC